MSKIFELDVGDYLITDESHLLDFIPLDVADTKHVWATITASYGIVESDAQSELLTDIFRAIAERRSIQ